MQSDFEMMADFYPVSGDSFLCKVNFVDGSVIWKVHFRRENDIPFRIRCVEISTEIRNSRWLTREKLIFQYVKFISKS